MKKTFIMALAALPFMMSSCGDKSTKSQEGSENPNQEIVAEQNETTDTETEAVSTDNLISDERAEGDSDEDFSRDALTTIRRVWSTKDLNKVTKGGPADIEHFALAFCNQYPAYRANKEILNYFKSHSTYEETLYHIEYQKKNGYLSCSFLTEYDWNTACCYWKRNNGHKLVAFWLLEAHEGNQEEHLLAFYDYDPDSDTMTPELYLNKKIDDAMKRYDTYSVSLPVQGKDINVSGYTINEEDDSAECDDYTFRWNGYDFDL